MAGQGLKVDLEIGGVSTMTFDEAMLAVDTLVDCRVIVSIGDLDGNACAGVAGVLRRRLDVGDDAETGRLSVLDIGVDGVVILSRAAYAGARWRSTDDGELLALQNGGMLLTIMRALRRPEDEVI